MGLKIYKIGEKNFRHNDTVKGDFRLSKFYTKEEFTKFLIVEFYGSEHLKYSINEIEVFDIGGSAETFDNFDDLFDRLVALRYPAFYQDGEFVFNPASYDLSEFSNAESDRFAKLSDIPEIPVYQAGTNITIDNTDPLEPIINSSGGGGSSANKPIFHWWGGNWTTTSLNLYYYIGFNAGAIETNPGSAGTTVSLAMQGRNKGLFIAPFDCKIRRVILKEAGSGSYTGKFALASGLPSYGNTWTVGYGNVIIHIDNTISSGGFWQNKFEFLVNNEVVVPKGYLISPMLVFSAQAQAGKSGVEISIEIEEVI